VFTLLAVSYFMTIVDLTIVNVALPTIGRKLHFRVQPAGSSRLRIGCGGFCCSADVPRPSAAAASMIGLWRLTTGSLAAALPLRTRS
jgi:hypothetical protein